MFLQQSVLKSQQLLLNCCLGIYQAHHLIQVDLIQVDQMVGVANIFKHFYDYV